MHRPKFEIFKSEKNSQFYFRLRSANNEIILASEGYIAVQGCETGIASVRLNSSNPQRYKRTDKLGNYTFNLVAANGEIIGRSESYTSAQGRDNGINAVMRDGTFAIVVNLV